MMFFAKKDKIIMISKNINDFKVAVFLRFGNIILTAS